MAITPQAQNWASVTQIKGAEMLDLMGFLRVHAALGALNSLTNVLTDAELVSVKTPGGSDYVYPSFAHLTQQELVDAYTVFNEYLTWIGDPAVGASRAAKLAKLQG
jgi:hypothetical protein